METAGFSIWVLLILIALMFVVLWGALFVFLALATWFIARTRLPDDRPKRNDPYELPPDRL